jgi:hypothetical protein
MGSPQMITAA